MPPSVAESSTEREHRASVADRLSERVLRSLAPLSFETATAPSDVKAALRMRYECAVEMGWIRPDELPEGLERDEHDERARLILCRDGQSLAGTIRVVPPDFDGVLPIERALDIRVDRPGEEAEAGRLVVARSHRGDPSHAVLVGLFSACWAESRALGYDRLVSFIPEKLVELYRRLGVLIEVLGPPRLHWGQERMPVEIRGGEERFAAGRATR